MNNICQECGSENHATATICGFCGEGLGAQIVPAQQQAQPLHNFTQPMQQNSGQTQTQPKYAPQFNQPPIPPVRMSSSKNATLSGASTILKTASGRFNSLLIGGVFLGLIGLIFAIIGTVKFVHYYNLAKDLFDNMLIQSGVGDFGRQMYDSLMSYFWDVYANYFASYFFLSAMFIIAGVVLIAFGFKRRNQ